MDDIAKRSLSMSKTFQANAALVWKILTTPEYMKEWWGPNDYRNTIYKMELHEGGTWAFTMHAPDGTDYENEYICSTFIPLKKLVLDHLKEPKFSISVTLFEEGNQTRVEWLNVFETIPSKEEAVRAFKADIGLEQNIERLNQQIDQYIEKSNTEH